MNTSNGALYFHPLFNVHDLGFGNPEPFVDRVIREFLKIGDAIAGRWIEMPRAILILQMVPGDPASGAVYLYDRGQHTFYMLCFDGNDDHLTLDDFDHLLSSYGLLRYAEHPSLLQQQRQAETQRSEFHLVASDLPQVSCPTATTRTGRRCRNRFVRPRCLKIASA